MKDPTSLGERHLSLVGVSDGAGVQSGTKKIQGLHSHLSFMKEGPSQGHLSHWSTCL